MLKFLRRTTRIAPGGHRRRPQMRLVTDSTSTGSWPARADLEIRSLLDDADLRRVLGLDQATAVAQHGRAA